MTNNTTKSPVLHSQAETAVHLLDDWFDPIEAGLRDRVREFIQTMIEAELEAALCRPRYGRRPKTDPEHADGPSGISGHRFGHRSRSLLGTFGRVEIAVPRARLDSAEGKTEWKSTALRAYQRRTKQADSLIAGAYLAGTNTRRVRRALSAVFGGAISKDTVSRVWRKVKADWDAWNARPLAEESIIRLILDGTVVRVRLDRKATSIVLLVVLGVREDGQKVLLAVKNMGGETSEAWRAMLDDLVKRGLRKPEFLIVDGGTGLEQAAGRAVGRRAHPTLHGPQAPQPTRPRAQTAARGGRGRIYQYDLRHLACSDRGAPESLHPKMAAQMQGRGRQLRGGR